MADSNRQSYILKSGMGTVAAADYDANPEHYGPVVEESDAQYDRRLSAGRFADQQPDRPALAGAAPMTTIANLATFDPGAQAHVPVMPLTPPIATPPVGHRVATVSGLVEQGETAKATDAAVERHRANVANAAVSRASAVSSAADAQLQAAQAAQGATGDVAAQKPGKAAKGVSKGKAPASRKAAKK